jgi:hypothetical protein
MPIPNNDAPADLFEHAEGAETRGILDTLLTSSRLYHKSADYKKLLDLVARLRKFAPFNAMLLQVQKPGLTYAATLADWAKLGGKLKPGVRPLLIMWPFGPVALVYDVMDIEGDNLPQAFPAPGPTTEEGIGRFRRKVEEKNINWVDLDAGDAKAGSIQLMKRGTGPNDPNVYRMLVNTNHPPPVRFVTLAHELAHLFLGHLGPDTKLGVPNRVRPTHALEELEAESVAYLVCKRHGVESRSETYLANFVTQHTTIGDLEIYRVMRAAGRIETLLGLADRTTFR